MTKYSLALETDMEAIHGLLKVNNLPHSDIQESPITFMVARDGKKVAGCIGLEMYGKAGLLRSFAVSPNLQNKGFGKALYNNLLEFARQNQMNSLHILTNTAKDYFSKIGYCIANRNDAPAEIANSAEFAGLCPASSTYMVLDPIS